MTPIYITYWAEHDNNTFPVGESLQVKDFNQSIDIIETWRHYKASGIAFIDGFLVDRLLITYFEKNEIGQTVIAHKVIKL